MRKIYLSFLGTSNYTPCNYLFNHGQRIDNVRFVQEATISMSCGQWKTTDEILIFTTDEAYQKNWIDNGQKDRDNNVIPCEGLMHRLGMLNLSAMIKNVSIPSGKKEQEIWDIFSILINNIQEDDELYIDITHAFRSLPLLATVIINYAKVMKNIHVKAISYGAMEAVGSVWDVKQIDIKKRDIPIFDLLPFDQLLDWSAAIDRFIASGDATGIHRLTAANVIIRKKEVRGPDKEADSLKKLAEALGNFSENLAACRGKNISSDATNLKSSIQTVKDQQLVKPLTPLLEKLEKTIEQFCNEEIRDGIAATRWCQEHNLIQQGFTLLQETMCTYVLQQATDEDANDKDKRNLVGMAVAVENNDIAFDNWSAAAQQNQKLIEKIRAWLRNRKELLNSMVNLTQNRNDLNHAGMNNNPMPADRFSVKLEKYIETFESQI